MSFETSVRLVHNSWSVVHILGDITIGHQLESDGINRSCFKSRTTVEDVLRKNLGEAGRRAF